MYIRIGKNMNNMFLDIYGSCFLIRLSPSSFLFLFLCLSLSPSRHLSSSSLPFCLAVQLVHARDAYFRKVESGGRHGNPLIYTTAAPPKNSSSKCRHCTQVEDAAFTHSLATVRIHRSTPIMNETKIQFNTELTTEAARVLMNSLDSVHAIAVVHYSLR